MSRHVSHYGIGIVVSLLLCSSAFGVTLFTESFDTNPFTGTPRWIRHNDDCTGNGQWDGYRVANGIADPCNGTLPGRWVRFNQGTGEKCIEYNGVINTQNYLNLHLSFRYNLNSGDQINCAVMRNGNWNNVTQETASGSWRTFNADVSPGVTSIRFKLIPGGGNGNIRVDCIMLTGDHDADGDGVLPPLDECPNDANLQVKPTWYRDSDNDGYGDPNDTTRACTRPGGYVGVAGDNCPTNPGLQNPTTWYRDSDGDGYGDPNNSTQACSQPVGYVGNNGDECPNDPNLTSEPTWYRDFDEDGYGDPNSTMESCTQPSGFVGVAGDQCPFNTNLQAPGICGCSGTGDDNIDDADGDEVCEITDNCPGVFNPIQADIDGDGTGDECDTCVPGDCQSPPVILGGYFLTGGRPVALACRPDGNGNLFVATANFDGNSTTIVTVTTGLEDAGSATLNAGTRPQDLVWGKSSGGDELYDVVVASDSGAYSMQNNGNGIFTTNYPNGQATFASPDGWSTVSFADVNGRGEADLVVSRDDSNGLYKFGTRLGDGGSSGLDDQGNPLPVNPYYLQQIEADYGKPAFFYPQSGDCDDSPGLVDLVIPRPNSSQVTLFCNQGDSNVPGCDPSVCFRFEGWDDVFDFQVGAGPVSVTTGQLGGSYYEDLAVVNSLSNTVSIILDPESYPGTRLDVPVGMRPRALGIADVNHDLLHDIVVVNELSNDITIILNQSNDNFIAAEPISLPVGSAPTDLDLTDVNGDGDVDIIVAASGTDRILVYLNNLSGFAVDCDNDQLWDVFQVRQSGFDCNQNELVDACEGLDPIAGDVNCDCITNGLDVQAIVDALVSAELYENSYPCGLSRADLDLNGTVNAGDIEELIQLLING